MKIVITGVHLSPALSIAAKLKRRNYKILFVGRKHALEGDPAISLDYQMVKKHWFKFKNLTTGRLQRKWTRHTLPTLLKIPIGIIQAFNILVNFRPNIVLSFGGYVAMPITLAAFLLRIPIIIHEQTLGAGLANRIAALFADKVLISWESSKKFFPKKKTVLVGNPIREEIFKEIRNSKFEIRNSDKKLLLIYITGGSLGSHIINITVEQIIERLIRHYIVIHQTGDAKEFNDYNRLNRLRKKLPPQFKNRYILAKYVEPHDIGWVLNNASLIVGRAGMNTVTELLALKKKAILIPLPISAGREQEKNAKLFEALGLGTILPQKRLNGATLYKTIKSMMGKKVKVKKEPNTSIENDATSKIVKIIDEITRER